MQPLQTSIAEHPSSFDSVHPPEKKYIDECVHCGFCLPVCPTYVLLGDEMDSPRGRIYMINKAENGDAPLDTRFREHMDNCLGCMACMTACPSGVQYDKLIEPTRAQIERKLDRKPAESLFRSMVFATFPYPRRLRLLALPLFAYQRSGLRAVVRTLGLPRLLPKRLEAMEGLLPDMKQISLRSLPHRIPAQGEARRRVGMLSGCVQQVFFSHVNAATARVLSAEGCEVIVPKDQPCCGALMLHSGLEAKAAEMAMKVITAFEAAQVDAIVINSAGCGSTMKEYGYLLRDDPQWAARAAAFAAKCRDISEILCELEPRAPRHPLKMRAAYHDACHLQHAQRVREQPRKLLGAIPDLEVAEIPEANLCCGSAGIYNLLKPEIANELGNRKVGNLISTHSQAVVSANPGCLLQLMNGLRRQGLETIPAFHLVELLDASIHGYSSEQVLNGEARSACRL
jgi:glycolate oxidase iron-sulfur subunit